MRKFIFLLALFFPFFFAMSVNAEDALIFDSTDHYIGACQLTDTSEWTLPRDLNVTTFKLWYYWNEGEKTLPVKISKDGNPFAEFTAERAECDPYQKQWCHASFGINKTFPKGTYATKIADKRQCLKPRSTGTVLLYGSEAKAEQPTTVEKAQVIPVQTPCPSCMNTIIIVAGIAGLGGFILSYFVFRKNNNS